MAHLGLSVGRIHGLLYCRPVLHKVREAPYLADHRRRLLRVQPVGVGSQVLRFSPIGKVFCVVGK